MTAPMRAGRMRIVPVLLVAALFPLAGCVGSAGGEEDPFAYIRKPLFASNFDLERVGDGTDSMEFRVQDGSIVEVRIQVWVNATAGDAVVRVVKPSGHVVYETTTSGTRSVFVELGAWRVEVEGSNSPQGDVGVLILRG